MKGTKINFSKIWRTNKYLFSWLMPIISSMQLSFVCCLLFIIIILLLYLKLAPSQVSWITSVSVIKADSQPIALITPEFYSQNIIFFLYTCSEAATPVHFIVEPHIYIFFRVVSLLINCQAPTLIDQSTARDWKINFPMQNL